MDGGCSSTSPCCFPGRFGICLMKVLVYFSKKKKKKKATNLVVTYITQYIFIYLLLNVNFDKLTIRLHFFYIIYVYKISKKSSINNYVIHQLFKLKVFAA